MKVLMDLKMSRRCIQSHFPNAPPPSNPRRISLAQRNIRKANPLQVHKDLHVYSAPDREECQGPSDLNIYSAPARENPNSIKVSSIYGAYRARSVFPPYFSA